MRGDPAAGERREAAALLEELVSCAHLEGRGVFVITHERGDLETFDAVCELPHRMLERP